MKALTMAGILGLAALTMTQSPPVVYKAIPAQRQLDWFRTEYYAFVHFGPNTFTNQEWGTNQPNVDVFNPTSLDTDQWAQSFKNAGMNGMILTAKHHDGMCLWNTSTTAYKIANSKWAKQRKVQGLDSDVVRMAAVSCKKYGIKFGVYLSPWDINRDPAMSKPSLKGTAYDLPQIFGTSAYNDFYNTQLTELVTMELPDASKVELFEIWLDGASGSKTTMNFTRTRFRDTLRSNQPGAVMWGDNGPDLRYLGNEEGVAPTTCWHTFDLAADDPKASDQGKYNGPGVRDARYFSPAEANSRNRPGWFWHPTESPYSGDALFSRWLLGPGRSTTMLLNVPPTTAGLIDSNDIAALLSFKSSRDAFINATLIRPGLNATASSVRGNNTAFFGAANAIDGNSDTYWTMNDGITTGWLQVDLGKPAAVKGLYVQEHIALGQRIGGWAVDALVSGSWKQIASGTSMGYKRIEKLSSITTTSSVRLRITQSNAVPLIQNFQVLGS